jgi:hypothetical protein
MIAQLLTVLDGNLTWTERSTPGHLIESAGYAIV